MKLFDIKYDSKTETIQLVYPNKKTEILADDAPSKPIKSSDNKKAVYISPLEWECYGNLYLVNLEKGEQEILVAPDNQFIPKNVIWLDNKYVLVIIGFGDGTVAVGGNIYVVNIDTKDKIQVTKYDEHIQITDLFINDGMLYYKGIKYIDDNSIKSNIYENKMELSSITAATN